MFQPLRQVSGFTRCWFWRLYGFTVVSESWLRCGILEVTHFPLASLPSSRVGVATFSLCQSAVNQTDDWRNLA